MKKEVLEIEQSDLSTMVDCVNALVGKGFTENFKATKEGLQSLSTKKVYKPYEINVLNFYRFEGNSDPADNSILFAIETVDGLKGTLADAYGPYADHHISKFMAEVDSITKKIK